MTTNDDFNGLVAMALNRMDTKNETAEEAAENVTGGNRKLDAQIVRALRGEKPLTAYNRDGRRVTVCIPTND